METVMALLAKAWAAVKRGGAWLARLFRGGGPGPRT